MKGSTRRIKSMGSVFITGLMAGFTLGIGIKVSLSALLKLMYR